VEKYCKAGQTAIDKLLMLMARLIPKATETHSEYVILTAFPMQHWLHERAAM